MTGSSSRCEALRHRSTARLERSQKHHRARQKTRGNKIRGFKTLGESVRTLGRNFAKLRLVTANEVAVLGLLTAVLALLPACSGSGNSNQAASSAVDPPASASLVAIQITPSTPLISLAERRQLIATGVYSDGTSIDVTSQATWRASSVPSTTNYVVVSSTGMAAAMG